MLSGRPRGSFSLKKKKKPVVNEPPEPKLDLLIQLPPDIIQHITTFLGVRDVLNWRLVCKDWKEVLINPALSAFWRRATVWVGVPAENVKTLQPQLRHVDDVFHRARHYTHHIARLRPEPMVLRGRYPFESSTRCFYAGQGYFVKTLHHQSLEEEETVIGELCPHRRIIKKVASIKGSYGDVVHAAVFANHVVWETSNGRWMRYNLETQTHSRLFEKIVKKENTDGIGFCRHCLFLVIGNSETIMHSYHWTLRMIKVEGNKFVEAIHRPPIPHKITAYSPRPVKPILVSKDGCKTHRLIVQGGTGGCVFDVTHSMEENKIEISKSLATLNPHYDLEIAVMVATCTSRFMLSPDESYVALLCSIVYPYLTGLCLYFFDLETFARSLYVRIDWREGFDDCKLLAVSPLYAVIAVGHSDGTAKVVHCRTGRVISSISPLSKVRPPAYTLARQTHVYMLGAYGDECLSDISGKLSAAIFFRKGNGNIEALFYDPFPPSLALLEDDHRDSDSDYEGY